MIAGSSRTSALYMDNQYEFYSVRDGSFAVLSNDERNVANGFEFAPGAKNRYRKTVIREDLDFVFRKKRSVIYKGDCFHASFVDGKIIRIHAPNFKLAHKYNMKLYDRDDYWLDVEFGELDQFTEKWIPFVDDIIRSRETTYAVDTANRNIIRTQGKTALYRSCQYELYKTASR